MKELKLRTCLDTLRKDPHNLDSNVSVFFNTLAEGVRPIRDAVRGLDSVDVVFRKFCFKYLLERLK